MAVLEKIRTKAPYLLVGLIFVALLAFILTDFLTSGQAFFGDGNTVAKVGSTKIDALDFQHRYEMQAQGQTDIDGAVLQSRVMNQMIQEVLLNNEIEALDIDVSAQEITEALIGGNIHPQVTQFVRQMGFDNSKDLYDRIFHPSQYGLTESDVAQAKEAWLTLEANVTESLKLQKLQDLIIGSLQANALDLKEMKAENATTSTIQYARLNYSTLKNDDYPVEDSELQAEYNSSRQTYRLDDEMREGHIIAVDITPSTADLNAAQTMINGVYTTLVSSEGVDEVRNNSDLMINESTVRLNDVRLNDEREFITRAAIGDVSSPKYQSNTYTLMKMIDKKMGLDSVNVSMMAVMGDSLLQDSVFNMLKAGTDYAEIAKIEGTQGQEDLWQSLVGAPDSTIAKFRTARAGEYFAFDRGPQGAIYMKINELKPEKQLYDIARVSYTVYPSQKTVDTLRDSLQAFIMRNPTAQQFVENATRSGYNAQMVRVSSYTPQTNGIENTREVVKWLFDARVGAVSTIYEKRSSNPRSNGKFIVAALDAVYDKGYMPLAASDVTTTLTTTVRNRKKGDALVAQYTGKANDVAGYAQAMNVSVDTTTVTFGQSYIAKIGSGESELTASVATAEQGAVVGPVKGNNAIYVYQVIGQEESKRTVTDEEAARLYARSRGNEIVVNRLTSILENATEVENMMNRFF